MGGICDDRQTFEQPVRVNGQRTREESEYELIEAGVFDDDRFWQVMVGYAKAGPKDMCVAITVSPRFSRTTRSRPARGSARRPQRPTSATR